jgi:hypothetical protein
MKIGIFCREFPVVKEKTTNFFEKNKNDFFGHILTRVFCFVWGHYFTNLFFIFCMVLLKNVSNFF